MLNSSMRIVNNLADAEDMVQDAFLDAFKSINSFTYKSSFEAWLRRIVINKSISHIRKKKTLVVEFEQNHVIEVEENNYNEEQFEYDINNIMKAIEQLPETQRIIFNLFTIDGIPQEEIGKLLGLSHNNVRTTYHRARKKIIELVKEPLPHG